MIHSVNRQKTKIVATVGPASSSKENLKKLILAGTDIFRLNFSHGSHENHEKAIENIIALNEELSSKIGILADLQGPKLRVGKIENNGIQLDKGDIIHFVNEECLGTKEKIYMSYRDFARDVSVGERVLVDDGKIVLEVTETDEVSKVSLKVIFGGVLSSNKGVNLPETSLSLPCLTEKDMRDLEFVLGQPVNWIALSFVRNSSDVETLKGLVKQRNHPAMILAKVEKPEAVSNIKDIIKASDAIMIARGDLGVEVPMEKLPAIQKSIIRKCIQKSKPVIVATQMMESMITNPSPTRAEITDVANAVIDGADAVMLSGETSVGNHPEKVVQAMNKIIEEAELHYEIQGKRPKPDPKSETFLSDTMCFKAAKTAEDISAKAVIGLTVSGYTGFKIASFRSRIPIYIFSSNKSLLGTLNLVWGVKAFFYDKFSTTDGTIDDLCEILKKEKLIKARDVVINTASMPINKRFRTNMMKITIVE